MSVDKMCRLCMGRSNLVHSVLENNLLQKIAICVSIMINPSDTMFPMELCALCVLKVQDFFDFRQNCLKVQQLLEQHNIPTQKEKPPPAEPILAIKEEKAGHPSVKPVELPQQITKIEAVLDEDIGDCLKGGQEEDVSIVETDVDRTIEELEETPDEDDLMDDLVEQDDVIFEAESVAETEHEQESDTPTTEDQSMNYHIEMIEFNFPQNPLEADLEEHSEEEEAPIDGLSFAEVEKIESNTENIEDDLQDIEEVSPTDITSASQPFLCRVRARKKYSGPKPPKPNLSEKEIYQSLLQTCTTCGKSVERNRMEGHRNRHLDVRPYICGVESCGTAFHCKISLRLHTKSRHGTEQLHCDLCGKNYTSRKALYHHKKESHAEKHYACGECGLVFVSNARLNRHKVTHTDQREFKCPHCPKEFYRSNNLKVHIRSHTKEKPFSCPSCDKAFGYQRLLREHVNRHH